MSAQTFALDLSKFIEKAKAAPEQVVRKVSIDLLSKVVLRTPVGNPTLWKTKYPPAGYVGGRLRANWNVSIGSPDLSTSPAIDKTGGPTIASGVAALGRVDATQPVYIMNSLPYVREIEYEGHSKQAPAGMVRVTVTEFQTFVNSAVRGIK